MDGPELAARVKERLPIRQSLFLVHGEDLAVAGLRERLSVLLPASRVLAPKLDDVFALTAAGACDAQSEQPRRMEPTRVGKPNWHNDLSKLMLDINEAVEKAVDERARSVMIRRLRSALESP